MISGVGPVTSKYCFIVDRPSVSAQSEGRPASGYTLHLLHQKILASGIHPEDVRVECLSSGRRAPSSEDKERLLKVLSSSQAEVLIPMGAEPSALLCGKSNVDKWVLSPLKILPGLLKGTVVPSYSLTRLNSQPELWVYFIRCCLRAKEIVEGTFKQYPKRFLLNPPLGETLEILHSLRDKEYLSVDIETGRGQINTLGFAWSPSDAIAIQVLPDRLSAGPFWELWHECVKLLQGESKKILQNAMYETQVFAQYGISLANVWHDTMVGQKFLWPEFKAGLGNVGRFYTTRPYWKDSGKVESNEEGQKDWGNIRDWPKHFTYNCEDTSGTYEACFGQRRDLEDRGLTTLFDDYIMQLFGPAREMCLRGLPVDEGKRAALEGTFSSRIETIKGEFPAGFNPASPKQRLELLKGKGYRVPKSRNSLGKFTESTNELTLKKLRLQHKGDQDIERLLSFAHLNKGLSSYIRTKYHTDGRVRFTLNIHGTETGRFACRKDAFDCGFNAQTISKEYAGYLVAPPRRVWLEIDLQKAESFFVAYDSCESTLIEMLHDGGDIHKYVAAEIYGKPQEEVTKGERQLGKKSGHGANYSMGPATFQDTCLKEMNLVLSKKEAQNALDAYFRAFPKIREWQQTIRLEVQRKRFLSNPLGRQRYFYGRMDDNLLREAYAYRPQSTIPDITNCLMLGLLGQRRNRKVSFDLHLQKHDSLLFAVREEDLDPIVRFANRPELWHPEITLPAGRLTIPVSCETGPDLASLKELTL